MLVRLYGRIPRSPLRGANAAHFAGISRSRRSNSTDWEWIASRSPEKKASSANPVVVLSVVVTHPSDSADR